MPPWPTWLLKPVLGPSWSSTWKIEASELQQLWLCWLKMTMSSRPFCSSPCLPAGKPKQALPSPLAEVREADSQSYSPPYVELGSKQLASNNSQPLDRLTSPAPDPAILLHQVEVQRRTTKCRRPCQAGVWSKAITGPTNLSKSAVVTALFQPMKLLGAESVLARIHHEITISKLFTPVALG